MKCHRASTATCARAEPRRRLGLLRWLLLLALLLLVRPGAAHPGHRSYCSVESVPGGIELVVQVPLVQLAEAPDGKPATDAEQLVLTRAPQLRHQLEAQLRATTPRGECRLETSSGPRLEGERERRGVFELSYACPAGEITLGSAYRFDVDLLAEMVCSIDGSAHVFRPGAADRLVGTPPSVTALLLDFVLLGGEHVLGGVDHVLFVLSLLLGAASAGIGEPGRVLRRVVALVTGFTLGHSVTLILAALGVVSLPSRLTESVIALSIVIVAVHNLLSEEPRGRGLTSAGFGLIHGFGFASVLAEIGLPRRGTVPALLAFNVGIELAQLALVLACFPLLVWAGKRPWFRARLLVPACVAIAGLASLWFAKRAFELEFLPWLGG